MGLHGFGGFDKKKRKKERSIFSWDSMMKVSIEDKYNKLSYFQRRFNPNLNSSKLVLETLTDLLLPEVFIERLGADFH